MKFFPKAAFAIAFLFACSPAIAETVGVASTYGASHQGKKTANGERFNKREMTAAHRTLPFGTRVKVCRSGCVVVRINDRGPFVKGRIIDLSDAAAQAIGVSGLSKITMVVE